MDTSLYLHKKKIKKIRWLRKHRFSTDSCLSVLWGPVTLVHLIKACNICLNIVLLQIVTAQKISADSERVSREELPNLSVWRSRFLLYHQVAVFALLSCTDSWFLCYRFLLLFLFFKMSKASIIYTLQASWSFIFSLFCLILCDLYEYCSIFDWLKLNLRFIKSCILRSEFERVTQRLFLMAKLKSTNASNLSKVKLEERKQYKNDIQ